MGIFDKAKDLAAENPDAIDQGIDKAADFADEKTGGQYGDQIDQGADFAKDHAGDVFGQSDQEGDDSPTDSENEDPQG
jgi:hypothetical protein